MLIIYNRHFPLGSFFAINMFGVIFCRSDKGRMSDVDKNHEFIHTLQQREMLFVGFYVWYVVEWLYYLIKYKNHLKAYNAIRFEREAYANQDNLVYKHHRRHFAWWGYKKKNRV